MRSKTDIQSMIKNATDYEMELVFIPRIMEKQTQEEIVIESSTEQNKIGLNAYDAEFITSLYTQMNRGKHISVKQLKAAQKILPKYWKQYQVMMGQNA